MGNLFSFDPAQVFFNAQAFLVKTGLDLKGAEGDDR